MIVVACLVSCSSCLWSVMGFKLYSHSQSAWSGWCRQGQAGAAFHRKLTSGGVTTLILFAKNWIRKAEQCQCPSDKDSLCLCLWCDMECCLPTLAAGARGLWCVIGRNLLRVRSPVQPGQCAVCQLLGTSQPASWHGVRGTKGTLVSVIVMTLWALWSNMCEFWICDRITLSGV